MSSGLNGTVPVPPAGKFAVSRAGKLMRTVTKILGVFALYAPPPLNRMLAQLRGVRLLDPKTTWIGVRTLIDNEFPELVTIGANVTIAFDVCIFTHIDPPATLRENSFSARKRQSRSNRMYLSALAQSYFPVSL